ncbi:MAG: hypothetical protein K6C06_07135 [Lachnospiraceae bacterium]|nr:hypothetical protein [Lachnospiraceae bacterium]
MKKMALTAAALVCAASFGLLTGFDSAATAEDVLAKYSENSKSITEAAADVTVDADVDLEIPEMETSFKLSADGTMDLAVTLDPIAVSALTKANASVLGQELNISLDMYAVTMEDGSLGLYTKEDMGEGAEWSFTSSESPVSIDEIKEMAAKVNIDFSQLPITFTLADEAVDVNGKSCYELTSTLTPDDMVALVQYAVKYAGEIAGEEVPVSEEDLQSVTAMASYLQGLLLNLTLDIDTETYQAMRFRIDFDGTDWAGLAPIIASMMDMTNEEGVPYTLNITANSLYMEYVYNYDEPVAIEVPAEALAAAEAQAAE